MVMKLYIKQNNFLKIYNMELLVLMAFIFWLIIGVEIIIYLIEDLTNI